MFANRLSALRLCAAKQVTSSLLTKPQHLTTHHDELELPGELPAQQSLDLVLLSMEDKFSSIGLRDTRGSNTGAHDD